MNKAEESAGLPPTSNYQYAKQVGNQLFIAGQIPHDSASQLVGSEDPATQATQCLTNLSQLLAIHGFDQRDIQRLVVYVVGNRNNLAKAWGAVETWFNSRVPPATLLGVHRLGYPGQLVEIDATIIRDNVEAEK